jgi:hypothetical protein
VNTFIIAICLYSQVMCINTLVITVPNLAYTEDYDAADLWFTVAACLFTVVNMALISHAVNSIVF